MKQLKSYLSFPPPLVGIVYDYYHIQMYDNSWKVRLRVNVLQPMQNKGIKIWEVRTNPERSLFGFGTLLILSPLAWRAWKRSLPFWPQLGWLAVCSLTNLLTGEGGQSWITIKVTKALRWALRRQVSYTKVCDGFDTFLSLSLSFLGWALTSSDRSEIYGELTKSLYVRAKKESFSLLTMWVK